MSGRAVKGRGNGPGPAVADKHKASVNLSAAHEDELLSIIHSMRAKDGAASSSSSSSAKVDPRTFSRRLHKIADELLQMGFKEDATQKALAAVSSGDYENLTTPSCLDWLLLHLPHNQIPARFATKREEPSKTKASASTGITIVRADPAMNTFGERRFDLPKAVSAAPPPALSSSSSSSSAAEWILAQQKLREEQGDQDQDMEDEDDVGGSSEYLVDKKAKAAQLRREKQMEQKRLAEERKKKEAENSKKQEKEIDIFNFTEEDALAMMLELENLSVDPTPAPAPVPVVEKKKAQKQAWIESHSSSAPAASSAPSVPVPAPTPAPPPVALDQSRVKPPFIPAVASSTPTPPPPVSQPSKPAPKPAVISIASSSSSSSASASSSSSASSKSAPKPVALPTPPPPPPAADSSDEEGEGEKKPKWAGKSKKREEKEKEKAEKAKAKGKAAGSVVDDEKVDPKEFDSDLTTWTGKTPMTQLREWCQREHLPCNPRWEGASCKKGLRQTAVVTFKDKKEQKFTLGSADDDLIFEDIKAAQHAVSIWALYNLTPAAPLYRVLPGFYRAMWMRWLKNAETAKKQVEQAEKDKRANIVNSALLIQEQEKKRKQEEDERRRKIAAEEAAEAEAAKAKADAAAALDKSRHSARHAKAHEDAVATNNDRLFREWERKRDGMPAYMDMLNARAKLPAWQARQTFLGMIASHQVVIVSGETGCGKTTQIPQFLLDDKIMNRQGGECNIIVTQPRRLAATAVAERVAAERCERIGQSVGYQIRLEAKKSSSTRLLFCTIGILLRRMTNDFSLKGVSHLVIDEVHERGADSDFLLAVLLDKVLPQRPDLKVVLMSATADSELFARYFARFNPHGEPLCPILSIPGRTFPVQSFYLEDAIEVTNHVIDPGSSVAYRLDADRVPRGGKPDRILVTGARGQASYVSVELGWDSDPYAKFYSKRLAESGQYSARTLQSMARVNEDRINLELIQDLIVYIDENDPIRAAAHQKQQQQQMLRGSQRGGRGGKNGRNIRGAGGDARFEAEPEEVEAQEPAQEQQMLGSILVFLPGMGEISRLYDMLVGSRKTADSSRFMIIPLHSALAHTSNSKKVFDPPPSPHCRKVVLATNIAETSVTIPDCTHVIDSGRVKQREYNATRRMECLVETSISRASARQRRGRAGRVREGICYHLYSRDREEFEMQDYSIPEIQRIPIVDLCLQVKVLGLGGVAEFLNTRLLQPPRGNAVREALEMLREVRAIDGEENLTALGWHLSQFPVDVRVGKMLIYASIFRCLDPILTIAACISHTQSIFVGSSFEDASSAGAEDRAAAAMRAFAALDPTSLSDHLILVRAFDGWRLTRFRGGDFAGRQFCQKNGLNESAMRQIRDLREQFADLLESNGFIDRSSSPPPPPPSSLPPSSSSNAIVEMDAVSVASSSSSAPSVMSVASASSSASSLSSLSSASSAASSPAVAVAAPYMYETPAAVNQHSKDAVIIRSVICSGLYPNVVAVDKSSSSEKKASALHRFLAQGTTEVAIHKSSVLADRPGYDFQFFVYLEKVRAYGKACVRGCSSISAYPLLLFGGNIVVDHQNQLVSVDDGAFKFRASPKTAVIFKELRAELDKLLMRKSEDPSLDLYDPSIPVIPAVLKLLLNEQQV